jgi:hypothetical protein
MQGRIFLVGRWSFLGGWGFLDRGFLGGRWGFFDRLGFLDLTLQRHLPKPLILASFNNFFGGEIPKTS